MEGGREWEDEDWRCGPRDTAKLKYECSNVKDWRALQGTHKHAASFSTRARSSDAH